MYAVTSPAWANRKFKPPFGSVEIDWGHPLANGLAFSVLANEGGGELYDLVRSRPTVSRGAPVAPKWTTGPGGLAHTDTVRYYTTDSATYNPPTGTYSFLLALHDKTGNATLTYTLGVWDGLDIDQKSFVIRLDGGNTVNNSFVVYFDGGGRSQFTDNIRTAGYHVWGFLLDTNLAQTSAYVDGTFSGASNLEVAPYLSIGNSHSFPYVAAPAASTGISIVTGMIWTRQLSPSEMQWATAEPYAFLRPRVRIFYSISAAATNFVAGGASPAYTGPFQPILARFP